MACSLAALALSAPGGARAAQSAAQPLAIVGATVIDVDAQGRSTRDLQDAVVLIRNGRVVAVGPRSTPIPRDARVIDAAGKFVTPGLIDGFGALRSQRFADAYLFEGVTSVFVLQAPPSDDGEASIAALAEGPRVFRGALSGEADALFAGVSAKPDQVARLVAQAKARGRSVLGEMAGTSYPEAARAGVRVFLRSDHYLTAFAAPSLWSAYAAQPRSPSAGPAFRAPCDLDPADPRVQAYARQLSTSGVALMPVLSIEATADDVGAPNPWSTEAAAFVTPSDLDDPVDPKTGARPYLEAHPERRTALQACARTRRSLDAALHRNGVEYLAGSGAPAFGILPGGGLHQELELLQSIGLTPREALAAATSNLADAFGWRDVGRVATGEFGDLLVLNSDPRDDVAALGDIDMVVKAGRVVDRARLRARAVAASAEGMQSRAQAVALLRQGLAAQGGEAALRAITSVRWEATGYRNMVEESERPEGPYITEFDKITELHDLARGRHLDRLDAEVALYGGFTRATVVDGDVAMRRTAKSASAGSPEDVRVMRENEALSPERLLLTALAAADLHQEPDEVLQSLPQKVVAFSFDEAPVRIYLNPYTHLPTAVDYSGPAARTGFWSYLGDVKQRTLYSFWQLAPGGVRYPLQWNLERNGLPDRLIHIHQLTPNGSAAAPELDIPDSVRQAFDPAASSDRDAWPLGLKDQPAHELAPGVVLIPGLWNTTLVRQDDGVVVIEAPISSGYSAKVIAEAHRRFPGLPIKAVVTTSDAWPHLAGIREYAARGVPVFALDLNAPILRRVAEAPYTSRPDAQQRAPKPLDLHLVSGKVELGTGPNRLELYPIRGETSERQMMVYLPARRLLYGSDAFQDDDKRAYLFTQNVTELMDAAARWGLAVDEFYMMHIQERPWRDLERALQPPAASPGAATSSK
jgi:hypothetical protein